MKCNGIYYDERRGKKTQCGAILSDRMIFCPRCGKETDALRGPLSVGEHLTTIISVMKSISFSSYLIALLVVIAVGSSIIIGMKLLDYWAGNLLYLCSIPLGFTLLSYIKKREQNPSERFSTVFRQEYFRLMIFVSINLVYFLLLKILCTGFLLGVATDPLLHIVRLILVIYWMVIISPVPFLISMGKRNVPGLIYASYHAGYETRWQQFYLLVGLGIFNVIGLFTVGLGVIVSILVSYFIYAGYIKKMIEFDLYK